MWETENGSIVGAGKRVDIPIFKDELSWLKLVLGSWTLRLSPFIKRKKIEIYKNNKQDSVGLDDKSKI